ncbi:DUF1501 domain-containing protein [Litorivicinus lipolyticus]|uniref:DUF1501 domain-containing protein n=1 Tax=Litorivicinus lipolyticus TaxID=418701 RepID=UPI003B58EF62
MNRRRLLQLMGAASSGLISPGLLAAPTAHKTLVLLHLKGANDGLNTLVPYESDDYRRIRPTIGLGRDDIIDIGQSSQGALGLHQSLDKLVPALSDDLAIVQGLGYPNQNRSHFKSIQLWESGSDGHRVNRSGWVTQSIEQVFPSAGIHGVSLQGDLGLFADGNGTYLSMARLNQMKNLSAVDAGATTNPLLKLVNQRNADLTRASAELERKLEKSRYFSPPRKMPWGELSAQLTDVLKIIDAEAGIPVLHVQLDGFDTHEGQRGRQRRLLQELAECLSAFRQNLMAMGRWDDTLISTYSEFGRRSGENGSEGTDHGTANVHFMLGGRVTPGLHGTHPDLGDLVDGDMQHTLDYRALYDQIAAHWWGLPESRWAAFSDPKVRGLIRV